MINSLIGSVSSSGRSSISGNFISLAVISEIFFFQIEVSSSYDAETLLSELVYVPHDSFKLALWISRIDIDRYYNSVAHLSKDVITRPLVFFVWSHLKSLLEEYSYPFILGRFADDAVVFLMQGDALLLIP